VRPKVDRLGETVLEDDEGESEQALDITPSEGGGLSEFDRAQRRIAAVRELRTKPWTPRLDVERAGPLAQMRATYEPTDARPRNAPAGRARLRPGEFGGVTTERDSEVVVPSGRELETPAKFQASAVRYEAAYKAAATDLARAGRLRAQAEKEAVAELPGPSDPDYNPERQKRLTDMARRQADVAVLRAERQLRRAQNTLREYGYNDKDILALEPK